jgi:nuclear pore complex protein Nup107
LQLIDVPVPPLATQVILEAYLQVLEAAGQRELIAMYASALGDNAVDRYAMFLTSLELTASISERKEALVRARDHGLDMQRVATATAERTIEKVMKVRTLFLVRFGIWLTGRSYFRRSKVLYHRCSQSPVS